ncbi:hypothetical protein [Pseudoalteromonas spongiae]|uniref:GAP1-N1 domain-containing protein n=1 Tax=Pseudoalteromonas spongiae TaxID=298657 RepID=UPI00110B0DF2|nr:hypothetical protein [Pseudoalteromonas spongiae]TMO84426.1 hypothetical protein CWC15_10780 [Pseudoalteromonas spongiae]
MTLPCIAKYGFKNNSHDLLEWNGKGSPPTELLGLTDKPAGHITPTEHWWPAINCGKVGNWWAIWSIEPDESAPRAGMVKSKAYLWPINEIENVNSLDEVISNLIEMHSEELSEDNLNIIDGLLNHLSMSDEVIMIEDVKLVPYIITRLWKNLWPEAKQAFSVRISFTPPQSFNTTKHPTFYCVPSSLTPQWYGHNLKTITKTLPVELSRAAEYLNGSKDTLMTKLLENSVSHRGSPKVLGRLARAATNIDLFRKTGDVPTTIMALRSIIACAPRAEDSSVYKKELLETLRRHISENSISEEQVLTLCNIAEENIATEELPKEELTGWLLENLPNIDNGKAKSFFERCAPGKSAPWWSNSIELGLDKYLATSYAGERIVSWILMESFSGLANKLLYPSKDFGNRLFDLVKNEKFQNVDLKKLESIAITHAYPKLYSFVILELYPEKSLFNRLINSMKCWELGAAFLVDKMKYSTLLSEIEVEEQSFIIPFVTERVKKDTGILNKIDISRKGAFTLWCLQLEEGGLFYPPLVDKTQFREKLLNKVSTDLPNNLIEIIVFEIAENILALDDKSLFLEKFDAKRRELVVDKLIDAIRLTPTIPVKINAKDVELIRAITVLLDSNCDLHQQLLLSCLRVPVSKDERKILSWILKAHEYGWANYAYPLGEIILKNKWVHIAEELYKQSYGYFGSKDYFKAAVDRCESLLNLFQRTIVSKKSGTQLAVNEDVIIYRLAELASELAHDRLESIWQRAGGKLGALHLSGSSYERWQKAIREAKSGALDGGICALADQLLIEFPNNSELIEIKSFLTGI